MEVHAHSHSARKKWTHYFWEFLMLFLAVTLGFLVENWREHFVEHQRANIYAANLYDELKKDTARLTDLINNNKLVSGKLDTFCLLSSEKVKLNVTNGMLYYYSSFTTWVSYFSSSNVTIEQLKGSGNLRIMRNSVSHKISEYDKKIRELEKEYGLSKTEFEKLEELLFRQFDGNILEQFLMADRDRIRDSFFKLNPPLIDDNSKLMKEFSGWMKFEAHIYIAQNYDHLIPIKNVATELLALLKKEYNLE